MSSKVSGFGEFCYFMTLFFFIIFSLMALNKNISMGWFWATMIGGGLTLLD